MAETLQELSMEPLPQDDVEEQLIEEEFFKNRQAAENESSSEENSDGEAAVEAMKTQGSLMLKK